MNFLSTYSDKKSCHTSTALQTSIERSVSDSWASCWFGHCVCSDIYDLPCCRWPVEQLYANRPVLLTAVVMAVMTMCFAIHGELFNSQGKLATLIRW